MIKLRLLFFIFLSLIISGHDIFSETQGYVIKGSNIIEKITYRTSSNYGINNTGAEAIDNDPKSCWISAQNGAQWIDIDFGTKRIMTALRIYPGKKDNTRTIKGFILQFKYNGSWFDYCTKTIETKESFFSKPDAYIDIQLGGIDASMFRIMIPEAFMINGYAAIAEIETYVGAHKMAFFDERLLGMIMPVQNGLLPADDKSYPNSPRAYRNGQHAGLDIYFYHAEETYEKKHVTKETPVLAVKSGTVIRADVDYTPMTKAEWLDQSQYTKTHPRTYVKRSFGGIQVWIDHGNGVVTTYNHLSKIAPSVKAGASVEQGEAIGMVGNSGLFGEIEGKDYDVHLHFEIWIDGYYLGRGMNIRDIKKYFSWIFIDR